MKSKKGDVYTVIVLGGKSLTDDLEDCLKVSCTNRKSLEMITEIKYDRLTHIFSRLGRTVLVEHDCFIVKVSALYKGKQSAGRKLRVGLTGFNRNR